MPALGAQICYAVRQLRYLTYIQEVPYHRPVVENRLRRARELGYEKSIHAAAIGPKIWTQSNLTFRNSSTLKKMNSLFQ